MTNPTMEGELDELATFIKRMARALGSDHPIAKSATEYLQEHDLFGSPLRQTPSAPAQPIAPQTKGEKD